MPFISFPRISPMVYTIENKTLRIEELKDKQIRDKNKRATKPESHSTKNPFVETRNYRSDML
jgi:hypothetical protein